MAMERAGTVASVAKRKRQSHLSNSATHLPSPLVSASRGVELQHRRSGGANMINIYIVVPESITYPKTKKPKEKIPADVAALTIATLMGLEKPPSGQASKPPKDEE